MSERNRILVIFRHGKPESSNQTGIDHDRELVGHGIDMSQRAGNFIEPFVIPKVKIICSTAARTVGTAKAAFNDKYSIEVDNELYLAPAQLVIDKISSVQDDINTLIVVGHNPGLTETVMRASNGRLDNLPMAGVCVIKYEMGSWSELISKKGELISFWQPGF